MQTILVIDDDRDICFITGIFLKKEGYRVLTALSPHGVLETINNEDVDLLLMDINLQGYDGRQICKTLKETKEFKIPIILFSAAGYNFQNVRQYLADGFVSKPFELVELKQQVLNRLNR